MVINTKKCVDRLYEIQKEDKYNTKFVIMELENELKLKKNIVEET